MASIAASAMKIGSSADARAALNLSSASQSGDTADISALFDQLLTQNVSPPNGGSAPQENSAAPSNENPASSGKPAYSASQQNFMQALLSANQPQQAAQPKAGTARPIPADPRAGFPRVAALIADPAWPPKAGTRQQAVPATAPQEKISDVNQTVNKNPATPSSLAPTTKSIAELLLSALSEPSPPARTDSAAPKAAPQQAPAQPRPNVVMDAKSFARLAPFVAPIAPTRPGLMATTAKNAISAPPSSVVAQAASQPQTATPKPAVIDQTPAPFADLENEKFLNSVRPQAAAPVATPSRAPVQASTRQTQTPTLSITDVLEGLRAAIVGDPDNTSPPALTIPATSKQAPSIVVASADDEKLQASVQMPLPLISNPVTPQPTTQVASQPTQDTTARLPTQSGTATDEVLPQARTNPPVVSTSDAKPVQTMQPVAARIVADTKANVGFAQSTTAQSPTAQPMTREVPANSVKSQTQIQSNVQPVIDAKIIPQTTKVVNAAPVAIQTKPPQRDVTADVAVAPKQAFQTSTAAPLVTGDDAKNAVKPAQSVTQQVAPKPVVTIASQSDNTNPKISTQSVAQPVVEAKEQAPIAPQTCDVKLETQSAAQPNVDAKVIPQTIRSADPTPVPEAKQTQPIARDVKQETSERQDAPRDADVSAETQTQQTQAAPQMLVQPALVADVKNIVQTVLAAQAPAAPAKAAPRVETNTPARGSLAAAFAAAAARSATPVQASPAEPRTTPAPVSDRQSVDAKDSTQPQKNYDSPAKNEPAAPAPVALNNATQPLAQPQTADNTILLPQSAVALTNDPNNAAATQATAASQPVPHLSANISASLQVGPKDQAAPAHAQQADLSAFAINIVAKSQAGLKHFDIRLDPAEMGRVEVRLSIDESGKATAHLSAEKPQTLDLLQRDAPELSRALKDSGLDLSQNGLNFSLKGQHQHNGGSDAHPRGTPLAVTATATPEPSAIPVNLRADNVRLDIHV